MTEKNIYYFTQYPAQMHHEHLHGRPKFTQNKTSQHTMYKSVHISYLHKELIIFWQFSKVDFSGTGPTGITLKKNIRTKSESKLVVFHIYTVPKKRHTFDCSKMFISSPNITYFFTILSLAHSVENLQ